MNYSSLYLFWDNLVDHLENNLVYIFRNPENLLLGSIVLQNCNDRFCGFDEIGIWRDLSWFDLQAIGFTEFALF